jgi:hypothetical protein
VLTWAARLSCSVEADERAVVWLEEHRDAVVWWNLPAETVGVVPLGRSMPQHEEDLAPMRIPALPPFALEDDAHDRNATYGSAICASRFLTGL